MATFTAALAYQRLTLSGFKDRPGQRAMIQAIEQILDPDHLGARILCVEGGTGTGKSMGYLLGAIPAALATDRRVVIATATVALQEQLLAHDLPTALPLFDTEVAAACSKGRRRFICDRALAAAGAQDPAQGSLLPLSDSDDMQRTTTSNEHRNQIEKLLLARRDGWSGDLDDAPTPLDPEVLARVTVSMDGCSGRACPAFNRCSYRIAKAKVMEADVVVTNHAMLLQDLALGGGIALPSIEESIVIIDEAHHLPEAALDAFTTTVQLGQLDRLLRRAEPQVRAAGQLLREGAARDRIPRTLGALQEVRDLVEWIIGVVSHRLTIPAPGERTTLRRHDPPMTIRPKALWPDVAERLGAAKATATLALQGLKSIRNALRNPPKDGPSPLTGPHVAHLGTMIEGMDRLMRLTEIWCSSPSSPHTAPAARWVESGVSAQGRAELTLAGGLTDPAPALRALLMDKAHALVLTSATLQTLGSFTSYASRVGLRRGDGTQFVAVATPFDLARQAKLVVPREACDPKQEAEADRAIVEALERLHARAGGTLVLFTARKQLERVQEALPEPLKRITQTSLTRDRAKVLDRHRKAVEQGKPAILLGLELFSEGVNLPGRQCQVVIVTRLPFRPPSGPIEETLEEWLVANGRNFFGEIALPDAYRRLVQRLGRLIRTEEDTGTIYVMDRRLVTTTYGRRILKTLPPYPLEIEPLDGAAADPALLARSDA